jgi:ADP-heptose:LPS heptosyltransferase
LKILAIQFRYLGDAALITPALKALREHFADCALHVLVAEESVPLFQHLPWVERVWGFPRRRGKANLRQSLPFLWALRRERFDRSVHFGSNDRGAIISRLIGAGHRLAPLLPGGFLGRRFCYTETVPLVPGEHEALRNLRILSAWGIPAPACPRLEICADPTLASAAEELLPEPAILCHLATSQPKKDWPVEHWAKLHRLITASGHQVVFATGVGPRERALLDTLKRQVPQARTLPVLADLAMYLAVLKRARLFITGDTGPMHFAVGLGVPTVALFGPSLAGRWAPLGRPHQVLQAGQCRCDGQTAVCLDEHPCMATIQPETVFESVRETLAATAVTPVL